MKNAVIGLLLCAFLAPTAVGQDAVEPETPLYGLGDQVFSINAGALLPLFIHIADGSVTPGFSQLTVGAAGSLQWGTFLNTNTVVGFELGGMFTFTILERTLIALPIVASISYTFRVYPFEFPLHAGLGVCFTKLENDLYVGPILKPGVAAYWNYNAEWAFGLRLDYWWIPEIYFGASPPSSQSAFGNFLGITFSTLYHF